MSTSLYLVFFLLCLLTLSIRGQEVFEDDNGMDDDLEELISRKRRGGTCASPQEKTHEKFFYRLYYGAKHLKGKTSYIHDNILLFSSVQVIGWTIQGRSGNAEGQFQEKPGYISEYEMFYLPVTGKWTQIKSASGETVFTTTSTKSSPDKVTEVTLSEPVVTSVMKFYPKDWEEIPYYKITIKYCPAPSGTPAPATSAPNTPAPTPAPTTKAPAPAPTTKAPTPAPTAAPPASTSASQSVEQRVKATLQHVKDVIKSEKAEKKLLNQELKKLATQKKAIEKEIRTKAQEAKNSNPRRRQRYEMEDADLDDFQFEDFQ